LGWRSGLQCLDSSLQSLNLLALLPLDFLELIAQLPQLLLELLDLSRLISFLRPECQRTHAHEDSPDQEP
jgi:hypothetical protein